MPFDRERQVLGRHADPVVADLDAVDAAAGQRDADAAGPGIDRILDQFLDRGGRTLDHLAGGDPVDDPLRQPANRRHGMLRLNKAA